MTVINEFLNAMREAFVATIRSAWKSYALIFAAFPVLLLVLTAGDAIWRMF